MGNSRRELFLADLSSLERAGLSSSWGGFLEEAASYCLENQGHNHRVYMTVVGDVGDNCIVVRRAINEPAQKSWQDLQEATEYGAYGVAILLILEFTEYTIVERSCKGTGFDYWVGINNSMLFQKRARLEVSGILNGSDSAITYRLRQKIEQVNRIRHALPAFIIIVEFGTPKSRIKRNG